jgi:hypothetical protein
MRANTSGVLASLCFAGVLFCGQAIAVPITYEDTLSDGVTVAGVNGQAPSNSANPVGAEYYRFFANAGSNVTVRGDRLAGHYDMSYWIFQGVFADTAAFGASFDAGDPGFIDFGDDEAAPNIPGPFGDPRSAFVAPVSGFYTIAVTNFLSNAGPPNPFELTATGIVNVPEPGTALLIGLGLAGFAFARRRASR